MTMLEYLEKDKEKLLTRLAEAKTPEKTAGIWKEESDRLLLLYNESCPSGSQREAAAQYLGLLGLTSPLIDCVGDVKVWEEVKRSGGSEKNKWTTKERLLLAGAGICVLCAFLLAFLSDPQEFHFTYVIAAVICGTAAPFAAWIAGSSHGKGKKINGRHMGYENGTIRTECRIDPDKVYSCLFSSVFAIDQYLVQVKEAEEERSTVSAQDSIETEGKLSFAEISLFSGLLEALYSEDGDFALDKLTEIRFYLHKKGVELVDFDGSNADAFDFMPSVMQKTIRPALSSEGKILQKGIRVGDRI